MLLPVPNRTLTVLIIYLKTVSGQVSVQAPITFSWTRARTQGFVIFQYGSSLDYLVQIEFFLLKGKCELEKRCLMVQKRVSHSLYILFSIISFQVLNANLVSSFIARSDNYPDCVNKVRALKLSLHVTSRGQMNASRMNEFKQ